MEFTVGDPKFSSVLLYLERFPRYKWNFQKLKFFKISNILKNFANVNFFFKIVHNMQFTVGDSKFSSVSLYLERFPRKAKL